MKYNRNWKLFNTLENFSTKVVAGLFAVYFMALQSSSALFRWLHPFWNRTLYAFLECWNKEHGTPLLCTVCTALAGKFFTLQWLESCKWTCKPFLKSCTQVPIIKELYQKVNQSKKKQSHQRAHPPWNVHIKKVCTWIEKNSYYFSAPFQ